jgi:hypothetical protein
MWTSSVDLVHDRIHSTHSGRSPRRPFAVILDRSNLWENHHSQLIAPVISPPSDHNGRTQRRSPHKRRSLRLTSHSSTNPNPNTITTFSSLTVGTHNCTPLGPRHLPPRQWPEQTPPRRAPNPHATLLPRLHSVPRARAAPTARLRIPTLFFDPLRCSTSLLRRIRFSANARARCSTRWRI